MNSISVTEHNDRVASLIVWLLDRNAPMAALGFNLSENTMRLIRELRSEIHKDTNVLDRRTITPCQCARCLRKAKAQRPKKARARVA